MKIEDDRKRRIMSVKRVHEDKVSIEERMR
jgi:hypothetical protein